MKSYEPSEFFLEFSWVSWVELDTETQNHGTLHIYTQCFSKYLNYSI